MTDPFRWRRIADLLATLVDNPPPGWRIDRIFVPNAWSAVWTATGSAWMVPAGTDSRGKLPDPDERIEKHLSEDGEHPPPLDELERDLVTKLDELGLAPPGEKQPRVDPNGPGTAISLRARLEQLERQLRNHVGDDDLTRVAQAALGDLEQLAERCAVALAHCGVTDDGQHPYSALLFELRRAARR